MGNRVILETPFTGFGQSNWTVPAAVDNVNGAINVVCNTTATIFPLGVTAVACVASDLSGNNATQVFTVTVNDATPPTVTCPADITVTSLATFNNVSWPMPNATDLFGILETQIYESSLALCASGVMCTVTHSTLYTASVRYLFQATDTSNRMSTCSWLIVVVSPVDLAPPTFTSGCLNSTYTYNISAIAELGLPTARVYWASPTALDDRPPHNGVTLTFVSVPVGFSSGSQFLVGATLIRYTATDSHNNSAFCTFNVVVTDTQAPALAGCNASRFALLTAATDAGLGAATVTASAACGSAARCLGAVQASDNAYVAQMGYQCGGGSALAPCTFPRVFPLGVSRVVFSATDPSGNMASCEGAVQVVDQERPVFSACTSVVRFTSPGTASGFLPCPAVTVSDNVKVSTFSISPMLTAGVDCNASVGISSRALYYQAIDAAGNTATCNITMEVRDAELPVFDNCNTTAKVFYTELNVNSSVVSWAAITAHDNTGIVALAYNSPITNLTRFDVGTHTVRLNATDPSGNVAICVFPVQVLDLQPPIFTNCPSNSTFTYTFTNSTLPGLSYGVFTPPAISAHDNVAMKTLTAIGLQSHYPAGNLVSVTYQAVDFYDNINTCTVRVLIFDTETPEVAGCPSPSSSTFRCPTTYRRDFGPCSWPLITATDNVAVANSGYVSVPSGFQRGSPSFHFGFTNLTFTATDAAGNSDLCNLSVVIFDMESPVFSACPSSFLALTNETGSIWAHIEWPDIVASDNVGMAQVNVSNTTGLRQNAHYNIRHFPDWCP